MTRWVVLLGCALVGLATATVSAVSLWALAVACSFHPWLAPALPVAVDVAGTVGAVAWVAERARRVRVFGQCMAITALVLTLVGNGLAHAAAAGLVRPTLLLVLLVGATIPLALYSVVHLCAIILASPQRKPSTSSASQPRRPPTPVPAPSSPAPTSQPPAGAGPGDHPPTDPTAQTLADTVAFWLVRRRAECPDETGVAERDAAMAHFSCSEITVKRARKRVREMTEQAVSTG